MAVYIHFKLRQLMWTSNQYCLFVLISLFTPSLPFFDLTICESHPVLNFSL